MRLSQAITRFVRDHFAGRELAAKTESAYRADLEQFADFAGADMPLRKLGRELVERWAAQLQIAGYAPSSARRKLMALRAFCKHWARVGDLRESPFWRMESSAVLAEKPRTCLTEKALRALETRARRAMAEAAKRKRRCRPTAAPTFLALRNLALVQLLSATGLRVSEACALDLKDYDDGASVLSVTNPRGHRREILILSAAAARTLRQYAGERRRVEGTGLPFFINAKGGRLSTQAVLDLLTRLRREANITQPVTPRVLRHTVERGLLTKRVDERVVLAYLGKTTLSDTSPVAQVTTLYAVGELRKYRPGLRRTPACVSTS
jgi:site-specific recombinase XerD